jgi:hypothetical protein|tara:strand:- start:97 stop:252 length:156 start_codon:yes stop_codon:yes gene_type:complete
MDKIEILRKIYQWQYFIRHATNNEKIRGKIEHYKNRIEKNKRLLKKLEELQ